MTLLDSQLQLKLSGAATGEKFAAIPPPVIDEPTLCAGRPALKLLIYVHTTPPSGSRRGVLRRTWANRGLFRDGLTQVGGIGVGKYTKVHREQS